ncbi:unnamed protein product [Amoebophrya sp. A120]|nr:unnamed protein product [Amoebophrya sp. A120]|eukprot:GSA120T00011283001.1
MLLHLPNWDDEEVLAATLILLLWPVFSWLWYSTAVAEYLRCLRNHNSRSSFSRSLWVRNVEGSWFSSQLAEKVLETTQGFFLRCSRRGLCCIGVFSGGVAEVVVFISKKYLCATTSTSSVVARDEAASGRSSDSTTSSDVGNNMISSYGVALYRSPALFVVALQLGIFFVIALMESTSPTTSGLSISYPAVRQKWVLRGFCAAGIMLRLLLKLNAAEDVDAGATARTTSTASPIYFADTITCRMHQLSTLLALSAGAVLLSTFEGSRATAVWYRKLFEKNLIKREELVQRDNDQQFFEPTQGSSSRKTTGESSPAGGALVSSSATQKQGMDSSESTSCSSAVVPAGTTGLNMRRRGSKSCTGTTSKTISGSSYIKNSFAQEVEGSPSRGGEHAEEALSPEVKKHLNGSSCASVFTTSSPDSVGSTSSSADEISAYEDERAFLEFQQASKIIMAADDASENQTGSKRCAGNRNKEKMMLVKVGPEVVEPHHRVQLSASRNNGSSCAGATSAPFAASPEDSAVASKNPLRSFASADLKGAAASSCDERCLLQERVITAVSRFIIFPFSFCRKKNNNPTKNFGGPAEQRAAPGGVLLDKDTPELPDLSLLRWTVCACGWQIFVRLDPVLLFLFASVDACFRRFETDFLAPWVRAREALLPTNSASLSSRARRPATMLHSGAVKQLRTGEDTSLFSSRHRHRQLQVQSDEETLSCEEGYQENSQRNHCLSHLQQELALLQDGQDVLAKNSASCWRFLLPSKNSSQEEDQSQNYTLGIASSLQGGPHHQKLKGSLVALEPTTTTQRSPSWVCELLFARGGLLSADAHVLFTARVLFTAFFARVFLEVVSFTMVLQDESTTLELQEEGRTAVEFENGSSASTSAALSALFGVLQEFGALVLLWRWVRAKVPMNQTSEFLSCFHD